MSSIYLECDKCSTTFCMPDNHWERSKDLRNEAVAAGWVCTEGLDRCFTDYCPMCAPVETAWPVLESDAMKTEAETYEACLNRIAQIVQDTEEICQKMQAAALAGTPFPEQMVSDAREVAATARETLASLVELRLSVL